MANIKEIYENAVNDPTLLSKLNVDEILAKIEHQNIHYLENKTVKDVAKEVYDAINELDLTEEVAQRYCNSFAGYRYIDRVCDLRIGRNLRWIKKIRNPDNKYDMLIKNSILVGIKILDKDVKLICKCISGKFYSVLFSNCQFFQKLTMEEQLILMTNDYAATQEQQENII